MNQHSTLFISVLHVLIAFTLVQSAEPYQIREPSISDGERNHWAFRPLVRPKLPLVESDEAIHNPIDRFVVARLQEEGVSAMPRATRTTLIRRLSFGLTGLPPTPAQVEAFVDDTSANAYERLVERLLASPAYGERWAQHWLDLARFAETDGFEFDSVRKDAWRYRDWVIAALNRDMPYDEFVRLQLAGDEVAPDKTGSHVATGFLMGGPDMPDINLQDERRHVLFNEMTSTVGSAFLGLTLECAQCHDHKYDPLSQADFYRFRAIFANTLPELKRSKQHPMTVNESGRAMPDARFMIRGDFRRPGPSVEPAFLRVVNATGADISKADSRAKSSMRRRTLAEWLTRGDHPLTARVMVNRVWMHHFGSGLVDSPSDFGIIGEAPTHPELLDWLACEFVRSGWSLKRLHKLIVTSEAYMRSSRPDHKTMAGWKEAKALDPNNELMWRRNRVRLDGEAIRDAMLVAAGRLEPRRGGPGVRPPLPPEVVATLLKNQWNVSPDERDHRRRSVYIFARRNLRFPIFEAFDRPDGNASCSRRSTSTTAPQALILLNSKFSGQMASALAADVREASDDPSERVRLCFERILSRSPTPSEVETSLDFLKEQAHEDALEDLCLGLFNLNEFVYVD